MALYIFKNVTYFNKTVSLFNYYSSYRVQKVKYLHKKCQKILMFKPVVCNINTVGKLSVNK
jgi:hypothetical protein